MLVICGPVCGVSVMVSYIKTPICAIQTAIRQARSRWQSGGQFRRHGCTHTATSCGAACTSAGRCREGREGGQRR
jgi:hypothetical protein